MKLKGDGAWIEGRRRNENLELTICSVVELLSSVLRQQIYHLETAFCSLTRDLIMQFYFLITALARLRSFHQKFAISSLFAVSSQLVIIFRGADATFRSKPVIYDGKCVAYVRALPCASCSCRKWEWTSFGSRVNEQRFVFFFLRQTINNSFELFLPF